MANGNTFSALSSQNPAIQSMILSAVPEGLQRLAACGKNLPRVCFTLDELDAIVEGNNTEDLESSCGDGFYLHSILSAINWWTNVAQDIAGGNGMEAKFVVPEYEGQKRTVIALLNDVLSSYAAAFAESPYYCSDDVSSGRVPAGMELMKRYRLFTRYVCAFAKEVWPDVNLEWLLKQA
jgi:hypothetical protein